MCCGSKIDLPYQGNRKVARKARVKHVIKLTLPCDIRWLITEQNWYQMINAYISLVSLLQLQTLCELCSMPEFLSLIKDTLMLH